MAPPLAPGRDRAGRELEDAWEIRGDRKARKPLVEKKRRARINESLQELRLLLAGAEVQAKLENAEVLELTSASSCRRKQASASRPATSSACTRCTRSCPRARPSMPPSPQNSSTTCSSPCLCARAAASGICWGTPWPGLREPLGEAAGPREGSWGPLCPVPRAPGTTCAPTWRRPPTLN
ncbi:transcription cofactor HES-6 isoform X2 [Acinonyx jubatus]|uniref:Transcription cofactor HES-6 isoform X2 n=1 Tax=Acinonyx jubatus TaxID=32536 RepID=A0ABM3NN51_ACIJB|nr:transcription cofactor HES-6 isoform X2 [Acinonyx jubatus]